MDLPIHFMAFPFDSPILSSFYHSLLFILRSGTFSYIDSKFLRYVQILSAFYACSKKEFCQSFDVFCVDCFWNRSKCLLICVITNTNQHSIRPFVHPNSNELRHFYFTAKSKLFQLYWNNKPIWLHGFIISYMHIHICIDRPYTLTNSAPLQTRTTWMLNCTSDLRIIHSSY